MTGTAQRLYEYIYSIVKTCDQPFFTNYSMRMNIKNADEIIEVSASFFESGTTGIRGSIALTLAWSANLEKDPETRFPRGWLRDPYDPGFRKGTLMNMSESRGLDGMVPGHPLSQARELVLALTKDSYYKTHEEIRAESGNDKDKNGRRDKDKKEIRRDPGAGPSSVRNGTGKGFLKSFGKSTGKDSGTGSAKDSGSGSGRGSAKTPGKGSGKGSENSPDNDSGSDSNDLVRAMLSGDAVRVGAYKVEIREAEEQPERPEKREFSLDPADIAAAAAGAAEGIRNAVRKAASELNKVDLPFEIPDDFRNKLNRPIRNIPGWGKRRYIGFGKKTNAMSALLATWPVTESESMLLTDEETLVKMCRDDPVPDTGLIDVKCGVTPRGNRYAYIIRKRHETEESKEGYTLGINIRINGRIHFIDSFFEPAGDFGHFREGILSSMVRGTSELKLETELWKRDPFCAGGAADGSNTGGGETEGSGRSDHSETDGGAADNSDTGGGETDDLLMDWTEDEKYDNLFPYSALSELRRFERYVIGNN